MVKRILGIAIFALGIALPAHAQAGRAVVGSSASGLTNNGGGGFSGGSGGGFSGGGVSSGSKLQSYPVACPRMIGVSGTQADFVPSTFVPYDKALTQGQIVLDTPSPTVAEAARELATVHAEKAKFAFVQDDYGNAMIIRQ